MDAFKRNGQHLQSSGNNRAVLRYSTRCFALWNRLGLSDLCPICPLYVIVGGELQISIVCGQIACYRYPCISVVNVMQRRIKLRFVISPYHQCDAIWIGVIRAYVYENGRSVLVRCLIDIYYRPCNSARRLYASPSVVPALLFGYCQQLRIGRWPARIYVCFRGRLLRLSPSVLILILILFCAIT